MKWRFSTTSREELPQRRNSVDVLVMGKDVFSRMSGSLAPFRLLLAQARRWKRAKLIPCIHQAWQAIEQQQLSSFL